MEIAGNDPMQFDKKEIAIAADCTEVELTLKHSGKTAGAGHGPQLGADEDRRRRARSRPMASARDSPSNYVKEGDARVIAHTKVIGGGQTDTVKFPTSQLKKGEAYTFFCSFPGHSAIMKGMFKFD